MKKFNIILLTVLGIFTLSSCNDFLDMRPTNSINSNEAITTAADAGFIMNGIMNRMTSSSYYGRNMFLYADAKGGDCCVYSQGRGNDALYSFDHSPSSGTYSGFWTVGYDIILQLNNMLENIAKIEALPENMEDFDNIKAQALTLRALVYFDLVRLYGLPYTTYDPNTSWGVPNVTTVLGASAQILRAKVSENYTQILSDLEAAEEGLSESTIGSSSAKNHLYINYWANKAIQAKVYLTMGNYPKALAAAKEVIESGEYELYSNDEWLNSWTLQYGSESIFEIYMSVEDSDLEDASIGGYFCADDVYAGNMACYGASDSFLTRLNQDATDVRHGLFAADELDGDDDYPNGRKGACYKYLGGVGMPGDGKETASATNIKVIRLSEIYLIAAECALNAGDNKAAAEYLQEIRKRAPGLEPATEANVTLDMILDEKSKELYCEGQRYWDMIRLGKTITYNDDILGFTPGEDRGISIDTKTFNKIVLPIFKDEITVNPGIGAQQNPGY